MKRLAVLVLVLLTTTSAFANDEKFRRNPRSIPGQYIVVLQDDVEDVPGAADDLARRHAGILGHLYSNAIKGFSVTMTEGMARGLSRHPLVAWVEEDGEVSIDTTQTNPPWGVDRIDQRDRPLNGTFVYTRTGSGVKAYIIDTGIRRTHAQFGGRAIHGYTAISDGRGSTDCNGHGTHVAGTVGGSRYGRDPRRRASSPEWTGFAGTIWPGSRPWPT